jgi:hypothetical protein
VQANVTMFADMEAAGGTVTLRLPAATARQLGLVPPDWKKDSRVKGVGHARVPRQGDSRGGRVHV